MDDDITYRYRFPANRYRRIPLSLTYIVFFIAYQLVPVHVLSGGVLRPSRASRPALLDIQLGVAGLSPSSSSFGPSFSLLSLLLFLRVLGVVGVLLVPFSLLAFFSLHRKSSFPVAVASCFLGGEEGRENLRGLMRTAVHADWSARTLIQD